MREFRAAIEARDIDRAIGLLADDVVFRSPVVFRPYRGRDEAGKLLRAVAQVFEDFGYTRELAAPEARDTALVFEARVGDRTVEGCDFIHTTEDGQIDEMFVMVRPLSGAIALAEAMAAKLDAGGSGADA